MVSKQRLIDLCEAIVDCPHSTPVWKDSGVIVLRSKNIRNGRLDLSAPSFTDEEHYLDRIRRATPTAGDLVITREAPMGEVCMIPTGVRCCLGQRMVLLRPNKAKVDPRYLLFVIQSPFVQHEIKTHEGTGSTVSNLRISALEALPIPTPSLPEQRAIATVLGALDDKIELNRRMNGTLEAMARALFKSWFVDFDPVRAKMEGRPTGLPAEVEALFPGELEDGRPLGWEVGYIGDVAENVRRSVQPDNIEPETPYIALEHMPRGSISLSDWGIADRLASNKSEFKRGEILFGKLRPYFHKVGIAPVDGVCSTDILVITPKRPEWFGITIEHVSSRELIDYTTALSTGTKMPRTNWNDIARYEITIPPITLASEFSMMMLQYVQRIRSNIEESRTLAALRDALLPKLMSGEVRVTLVEPEAANAL